MVVAPWHPALHPVMHGCVCRAFSLADNAVWQTWDFFRPTLRFADYVARWPFACLPSWHLHAPCCSLPAPWLRLAELAPTTWAVQKGKCLCAQRSLPTARESVAPALCGSSRSAPANPCPTKPRFASLAPRPAVHAAELVRACMQQTHHTAHMKARLVLPLVTELVVQHVRPTPRPCNARAWLACLPHDTCVS